MPKYLKYNNYFDALPDDIQTIILRKAVIKELDEWTKKTDHWGNEFIIHTDKKDFIIKNNIYQNYQLEYPEVITNKIFKFIDYNYCLECEKECELFNTQEELCWVCTQDEENNFQDDY
jgi:hypothetical protein